MVTDRPYRKGMTLEKAIEELKRNRGTQFDPVVVDALVNLYEEGNFQPAHLPDPANGGYPHHMESSPSTNNYPAPSSKTHSQAPPQLSSA